MLSVPTRVETMTQGFFFFFCHCRRTCRIDETKRVPACPCASDPIDNDVSASSVVPFTCKHKILDPSSLAHGMKAITLPYSFLKAFFFRPHSSLRGFLCHLDKSLKIHLVKSPYLMFGCGEGWRLGERTIHLSHWSWSAWFVTAGSASSSQLPPPRLLHTATFNLHLVRFKTSNMSSDNTTNLSGIFMSTISSNSVFKMQNASKLFSCSHFTLTTLLSSSSPLGSSTKAKTRKQLLAAVSQPHHCCLLEKSCGIQFHYKTLQ